MSNIAKYTFLFIRYNYRYLTLYLNVINNVP